MKNISILLHGFFLFQKGDLKSVKCLISGVQSYNTDLSRFSYLLFDCIDNKDTDIAKYLIGIGFKSEIWKEVYLQTYLLFTLSNKTQTNTLLSSNCIVNNF